MAQKLPHTHYACPCTDITTSPPNPTHVSPEQPDHDVNDGPLETENEEKDTRDGEEKQETFNPYSPRANYALYPLESLLFCNECHELRCPRCWYEEATYYYCPNCLFETGASVVKNETNRCTRSCFQCPICIATLSVASIRVGPREEEQSTGVMGNTADGPFVLSCAQCSWTSMESGLIFDKSINIHGQLMAKIRGNAAQSVLETPRELASTSFSSATSPVKEREVNVFDAALSSSVEGVKQATTAIPTDGSLAPDSEQFARLSQFYNSQLGETSAAGHAGLGFLASQSLGFDSPSTLSRLLSTYGVGAIKKQKGRMPQQREALNESEGLYVSAQPRKSLNLPIATQLRIKRSKRCPTCRSPLSKPEEKRHSTRYKIRLLASNHVPSISLKPYNPHPLSTTLNLEALETNKAAQFLLTVRNPIFDTVRVSLATPRITPGTRPHKVTILCPTFEVGANTDVWDEALDTSMTNSSSNNNGAGRDVAEAGKVWEKGRNWTTVILELVPSAVVTVAATAASSATHPLSYSNGRRNSKDDNQQQIEVGDDDSDEMEEIQIPIHIRLEYETEDTHSQSTSTISGGIGAARMGAATKEVVRTETGKIQREVSFWVVGTVGRVLVPPSSASAALPIHSSSSFKKTILNTISRSPTTPTPPPHPPATSSSSSVSTPGGGDVNSNGTSVTKVTGTAGVS